MPIAIVLFIVFITLKLADVVAWSWLWVTAPLWIGFAVWLVIMLVAMLGFGAAAGTIALLGRGR